METLPPLLPPPPSQDEREKEEQLTLAKVGGWVVLDSLFFSSKETSAVSVASVEEKGTLYTEQYSYCVCVCNTVREKEKNERGKEKEKEPGLCYAAATAAV